MPVVNDRNKRIQERINKNKRNMLFLDKMIKTIAGNIKNKGFSITVVSKANGMVLDPEAKHYKELVTTYASLSKITTELEDKLEKVEVINEADNLFNMQK